MDFITQCLNHLWCILMFVLLNNHFRCCWSSWMKRFNHCTFIIEAYFFCLWDIGACCFFQGTGSLSPSLEANQFIRFLEADQVNGGDLGMLKVNSKVDILGPMPSCYHICYHTDSDCIVVAFFVLGELFMMVTQSLAFRWLGCDFRCQKYAWNS